MKLTNDKIKYICLITVLVGIVFLNFYDFKPEKKKIGSIEEGDYVQVTGFIQSMEVTRDRYGKIQDIKYIKIIDDTGGDLRIYPSKEVKEDLIEYIYSYTPSIKENDLIQVVGRVEIFKGIYLIRLKDIKNFKLIEKRNFERDIFLSPTPTGIYASKYGKVYHTSNRCPYGKKIKENNKIYFYTEEDARDLGYRKCKWCASEEN
ncbi:hypothetical protein [Methanofervidicoccus abyssi]|uniref:Nucleic acid binding OB-fold tRNA/helicase-type n=1 Tax=Methanofervidicoccus abyssi TaxID=2082189 RepID=A0A401HPV2_9EURY|nr:hypothetical protein [Methanofervidicoccus abyssi]GBF36242.1 conserved hypothetical protein [Methanofervidicoccus abyssi]